MTNYTNEDFLKDIKEGKKVTPLLTKAGMAKRWGLTRTDVQNMVKRDKEFPKPLEGVVEGLRRGQSLFPLHVVEEYEKEKGLLNKEGVYDNGK